MQEDSNGRLKLRPKARIIKTIGEELISDDVVALLELVKNSYDAGAEHVQVIFNPPLKIGSGSISVRDDGSGMDFDTIEHGWMEPATTIKSARKSRSNRKMLGEKGIGRFASAKLSSKLELITRKNGGNEIITNFNWEVFDDTERYLDEIDCEWRIRKAEEIKGHGTWLTLNELKSGWDYEKIKALRISLSRLINPFKPIKGFEISLDLPEEFKELDGKISTPGSVGLPHYIIKGNVDEKGHAVLEYSGSEKGKAEQLEMELTKGKKLSCGPFGLEFRVWDRDELNDIALKLEEEVKTIRDDLNDLAGISIFRDGFKVLPYGEKQNDWLRLDLRRVQNPTKRLSNNQIIGYVSISLETNPLLIDQSNREGIVESPEFTELKDIIIEILNQLEIRRYRERRKNQEQDVHKVKNIFLAFNLDNVAEIVNRELPKNSEIRKVVAEKKEEMEKGVRRIKDVLARYRRLSTLGLLLDVVIHDGNNELLGIDNQILLIENEIKGKYQEGELNKYMKSLKQAKETLAELFKRLEPFSGRKRKQLHELIIEDSIKNVIGLFAREIKGSKIEVEVPDTNTIIKADESDVQIIFVNLLQNSLYWLKTVDRERKIIVEIEKDDKEVTVVFSDNGPGVKEDDIPYIFDPYYTTKPEGVGLGLTIAGELVTEYNGSLELIKGPLSGANFQIKFGVSE